MTFQNGEVRELPVAGIYSDAALVGNWLMSSSVARRDRLRRAERLLRRREDRRRCRAKTKRWQAIETALVDYPQAKIETADQFKDSQAAQIDQLLVIITVLLAFAIIIAVLGISITLGLAVFERTREIGLMRAVGMTRRQTRRMVRWEAIIVSTFGAIVGIVLGTLIGIVLSLAVPDTIIDGISFSVSTIIAILIGAVSPASSPPSTRRSRPRAWTSSRRSPPSNVPATDQRVPTRPQRPIGTRWLASAGGGPGGVVAERLGRRVLVGRAGRRGGAAGARRVWQPGHQ